MGLLGAAVLTLWAFAHHPLTHDNVALAARTHAGHVYGIVLLAGLLIMTVVGYAATVALDRVVLPVATRRRIGTALLVVVALVPVVGVVGIAASSRGLTGEVSHLWHSLTSANTVVTQSPGRLAQLSNSRPRYWREGLTVGEHALLAGTGAGGFLTARARYTSDTLVAGHAHSYVIETFADFGLIGVLLSLALFVAWIIATGRTLGLRHPRDPPDAGHLPERAGLLTMLAIVIAFGVHSAIDWTWFFPGVTIPALACAGWLAGRGPLGEPVGRGAPKQLTRAPASAGIVVAIVAIAIAAAWVVWQPLRSSDADASAVNELLAGRTDAALADAQTAVSADPVSAAALWELSEIHVATGDLSAARSDLVRATDRQPSNSDTWQRLGEFDLRYHHPRLAMTELDKAVGLDLTAVQPLWDLSDGVHRPPQPVRRSCRSDTAAIRQPHSPQAVPAAQPIRSAFNAPQSAVPELQAALSLGAPARRDRRADRQGAGRAQRTARASSSRRKKGGPPAVRTLISSKSNSASSAVSDFPCRGAGGRPAGRRTLRHH